MLLFPAIIKRSKIRASFWLSQQYTKTIITISQPLHSQSTLNNSNTLNNIRQRSDTGSRQDWKQPQSVKLTHRRRQLGPCEVAWSESWQNEPDHGLLMSCNTVSQSQITACYVLQHSFTLTATELDWLFTTSQQKTQNIATPWNAIHVGQELRCATAKAVTLFTGLTEACVGKPLTACQKTHTHKIANVSLCDV